MTADELLRRYPRETLRWLRGRRSLTQEGLAALVPVGPATLASWERGRSTIRQVRPRRRLAALLAPHLATPEGEAFARSLGRGEASEG